MKQKAFKEHTDKTEEQLIAEVIEKLRTRNPNFVDARHAMECISEVFVGRPQPSDIIQRVMHGFCSR